MSKFSVAMKRFGGFLKRNAFYLLIILCIAAVATVIALAVIYSTQNDPAISIDDTPTLNPDDNNPSSQIPENPDNSDQPQQQPTTPEKKLTFNAPCSGSISWDYSGTQLVFNPSMGDYRTHNGVDFTSDDLIVLASADGTVTETGYNSLDGQYIVITHEDGYTTKYMSLDTDINVKVGDKVEQGQQIGMMSASQGREALEGAHVHFEMYKDGVLIDPISVLVLEEK